ncbi:MAG TPA: heparan-alpha-glucosaminide N-acetyltransferase domain-containing protein [Candidatus Eisenbacteria bacterium]|nr:heparan-alpha-glucosaminide N-acetyltransferase domain-containing protein [Candidatus Eisenbacteria bacterium]
MSSAVQEVEVQRSQVRLASPRLYSLDIFRGATIAAMILVNNPGNDFAYAPLQHAKWNGWTPTDLIFPFFLFIVGVSLVLSFRSRVERGESKRTLLVHTLRRSAIIFLIGLFLNGFPLFHLATWRVAGVLQRIAIAYLAAALITFYSGTRGIALCIAGLLIGYWVAMRFIPVPGIGMPGSDVPLLDPDGNLAWYIDKLYLPGAMYEKTRDPEGILSTFPAITTALIGVLTGQWLMSASRVSAQNTASSLADPIKKARGMLAFGAALILAGQLWAFWFPINKKLWTSSFVLFAAGCALVCLAACYWITDVKQHRGVWTKPFVIFGTNAIAAYALADTVSSLLFHFHVHIGRRTVMLQDHLYSLLFGGITPKALGSLVYAIAFVMVCWLPIYWMYRKRIFLKV